MSPGTRPNQRNTWSPGCWPTRWNLRRASSSRAASRDTQEPAIAIRDLTGTLRAWIDVGAPDAARLHKASKLAGRVAVYTHKDVGQVIRNLQGERIHRAEALELYALDRSLVAALAARLERRMAFSISINERELYISIGPYTIAGAVVRHPVQGT